MKFLFKLLGYIKKQSKFKKFFLLSLLPYAIIIVICLVVAIFGYEEPHWRREYGLTAVYEWLSIYLFDAWLQVPNRIHLLFLIIVPYQMLYILKLRHIGKPDHPAKEGNELDKIENIKRKETKLFKIFGVTISKVEGDAPIRPKTKGQTAAKVIFVLSFIPHMFILLFSIPAGMSETGVNTGLFGSVNMVYGMEAFLHDLSWGIAVLIVVPILPICVIYQIIYIIVKIIEKKKAKK
ncbi:MAG: hypothetical protein LBC82_07185 [Oscillospiraceae bacterium]|jgi:hypothetical protein|nr:hypothetical protein [Oscillospiraceae bacterium]